MANIPDSIKQKHSQVPWQSIKNFRNVIIHKYHDVKVPLIWDIVCNKLPDLQKQIYEIIKINKE